jgi:capsular exopolysaccharide synthesis family protein
LTESGLAGAHAYAAPNTPSTEPFRTLRTSILLNPAATSRLLISSSEPADGKTTVAINLAVAFAQAGKRTLLIDADLRKPGLTTRLDLKSHAGLADLLVADAAIEHAVAECIVHTEQPSLHVLSTGRRRPNPAELLGNGRLTDLLAWAEANYDQVLVDCPPVLAVSDAHLMGRLVDGALLVVRPEKNHRRTVVRAVESLTSAGCAVIGVVANGITAAEGGYGYGYGYGYGHDEEVADWSVAAADEFVPSAPPIAMAISPASTAGPSETLAEPIRPRRAA